MKLHSIVLVAGTTLLAAPLAFAQHEHGTHPPAADGQAGPAHGPYAGMHERPIKAFSEQQVADLRAGKGMSLALPAELNGYPGPSHTLELADQLKLTPEQKVRTQALFMQMQQEAKTVGEQVISAEAALDRLFREKQATPEALQAATAKAAQAQGQLRETHLRYHLVMGDVLLPEQVAAYNRLRGY